MRPGKPRGGGEHRRLTWWQATGALLPCALLATAWGAAIAAPGGGASVDTASYSAYDDVPEVPVTGPELDVETGDDPVSQQIAAGEADETDGRPQVPTLTAAASQIPAPALAAYQRAASVMASTKPQCRLSWELLAAIGRVESNHGQFGGATIAADGATTRPIVGIPLDGSGATARILDTDRGAWDGDKAFDRAVGPMQFIPSTWSSVGVDADGDGEANPNNINDASLAAAVYLCVGGHDLSTEAGARAALMSYNRSTVYGDQVLAIAAEYGSGQLPTTLPVSAPGGSIPGPVGTPPLFSWPSGPGAGHSQQPAPAVVAINDDRPLPSPWGLPGGDAAETIVPAKDPVTPVKPKPTKPTKPTPKPTDPTPKPTDPTPKPTDPTTPTDPTDPTTPTDPTPTGPTTPPPTESTTDPTPTDPGTSDPTTPQTDEPTGSDAGDAKKDEDEPKADADQTEAKKDEDEQPSDATATPPSSTP
ncbi:membrane-bound lytic murein transglycosylase B [Mumia flava]|uniref:Membrane-bound lytic murein transglycosylase B n=1 Tax=Mumia flava TaxID=1348852 RepID=A0A2M9BJS4_9ACTN|nr:lytic transglycosylase domain-containing protein [Mumia flava]PJJ58177.1 membrane-bound lytic murein transglycosylase B [Mumia flava]